MKIKLLNERAVVPTYGSSQAAGADLYAAVDKDIYINPHSTTMIGTGIAAEIPEGAWFPHGPSSGNLVCSYGFDRDSGSGVVRRGKAGGGPDPEL